MTKQQRQQRRKQHVQDESVIDHLMGDLTKPSDATVSTGSDRARGDGADAKLIGPRSAKRVAFSARRYRGRGYPTSQTRG